MTKPNLVQLKRLVGNPDAYAVQYVTEDADGKRQSQWRPVRAKLTDPALRDHLAGNHTLGTYIGHKVEDEGARVPARDGNAFSTVARTLVFDLDSGGGEVTDQEMGRIGKALHDLGIPKSAVGEEFSGSKGFHIWVLLQEYRPNSELRRVGRAVLAMADVDCEVYPKQDEVKDLGNLVKLPGGIHQLTGNHNDFIGSVPMAMPTPAWLRVFDKLPPEQHSRRTSPVDNRFPCLEAIQDGVSEGGRNIQLFQLGVMMRRAGATDDTVMVILESVNARCEPPLDEDELNTVFENSRTSGPVCGALPERLRDACGDCCIRERTKGLYARPGQVRHAGVGESVVVRIGSRVANVVTFEHDDIATAKAALRVAEGKD
jgi:hypothetical protein